MIKSRKAHHLEEETAKFISRDEESKDAANTSRNSSFNEASGQRNAKEMHDKAKLIPKSAVSKMVEDPSDSGDEEVPSDSGVEAFSMIADSRVNVIVKFFEELTTVIENVKSAWVSNMEPVKQMRMMVFFIVPFGPSPSRAGIPTVANFRISSDASQDRKGSRNARANGESRQERQCCFWHHIHK